MITPNKLWNTLIDANEEKYAKLLYDLQIKQKVLNEQINIISGIQRKRLVNLVNTVEDILDSVEGYKSKHHSKISDLKSEESATERKGLKILVPSQMLSRLPISLAQLKAGNNSEKLKSEIRQLLYSLYKSKIPTKQLYESLFDIT